MKTYRKIILTGTGLLCVAAATAQEQKKDSTLNRTVVVENQYNPEVMDAFKVNVLPKVEEPAVAKKNIDYATSLSPLASYAFEPMGVITRDVKQKGARRGYLRGAYGMLNNTDVKAAYLWDITRRDRLDVMASFYGYSGDVESPWGFDNNQRFFRSDASLEYSHVFNNVKFNLGGSFGSQVFNYIPITKMESELSAEGSEVNGSSNQHFMMGEGHLGVNSIEGQLPMDFSVMLGFDGFKRMHDVYGLQPALTQKRFYALGGMSAPLAEEQKVGIDLGANYVMYSDEASVAANEVYPAFENNILVQVNPYYALERENLTIRLGAHVDYQSKVRSGLKVSPDVKLDFSFLDSYVLYAQALGGTQLNDFNRLNKFTPYWNQAAQLATTYTVFDARAGFKASPVNGLGFHLYGGYRLTKDDLFVNVDTSYSSSNSFVAVDIVQDKSKVAYFGASIDYDYRDVFGLGIRGQYNDWKIDNEANINYLRLKPEYTIGATARAKVYKGVHALAEYQYEKRKKVSGTSTDPVNFLKVGAEYNYNDRINVFLHVNNLLDKYYLTEAGYPTLGLHIMGGVSVAF